MRDRAFSGSVYLLGTLATAVVTALALPVLLAPPAARGWADWHRQRAGRLLGVPVDGRPGGRRNLAWALAHVAVGFPLGLAALLCLGNILVAAVALPLWWAFPVDARPTLLSFFDVHVGDWETALVGGSVQIAVLGAAAWWVLPALARLHARLCLAVLAPSARERLTERVDVLTRSRVGVVDAHGAELQRIERDLHDGTQARLVAIAMQLGMARESLADDPDTVAALLAQAHETAEEAMVELRAVLQTIYPPILADRGLDGALTALAARSSVPVHIEPADLGALPATVEAVAYYVIAEALTNVAKHAAATRVALRIERADDVLSIEVIDDGRGGADEARGTGIAGICRRVAALDGTVRLDSPPGGPTTLAVRIPCV
ncbi:MULTISPECIES: sensor histidine kinase [Streptosporangium]|uniref:histidine kinase n=1 Tax=Streptosporangium brasiliense TaxID=47480 RepID=A0ABT9RMM4_9ACTN|nr:sensor histidine kinase [Streptosporangium brasiliense]MDP9869570.1 signal transduction histidine kinase [Streptosporangium brasiliense]